MPVGEILIGPGGERLVVEKSWSGKKIDEFFPVNARSPLLRGSSAERCALYGDRPRAESKESK